jgi:ABC-2 type transport system ATP-binding protein
MIEVDKLSKYFGERAAIRDLSFSIAKGEVVGFLGLNGAGKTTTLRILGCLLLPTSGTVRVDGLEVTHHPYEIRGQIGFLPDVPPLYPEMTVGSYLTFAARLRQVPARETAARVAEAEEKTALRDVHGEVISELSHGYRQRVGLAQAIVHKPALLILDEPSAGLDPAQIVEMRNLLRGLHGEHTVLISSHFLTEISQTCDRLLVIHNGDLVGQGSEGELASAMGHGRARSKSKSAASPRAWPSAWRKLGRSARRKRVPLGRCHGLRDRGQRRHPRGRGTPAGQRRLRSPAPGAQHLSPGVDLHEPHQAACRRPAMTAVWLIARRELGAYLRTMSGYVIAAIVLFVDGILFNVRALGSQHDRLSTEVLSEFFFNSSGLVMAASVFLSMRLLAEERQNGSMVLLASSPVREREIVLGKFLSAFIFLTLITLAGVFMPMLILVNGKLSFGHVAAGYLGLLLLGSAALAIGTLGSTLARSQIWPPSSPVACWCA